jgi:hypothetical protein
MITSSKFRPLIYGHYGLSYLMYQRDYILKMIEMIGDFIAAIMGLIRKGKFEEAEDRLSNLYYNVLKEDAAFFRNLKEEDLTTKLLNDHNYTNNHLEILAELFNTEAELNLARGNYGFCIDFSRKSLILFEFIDTEQRLYSPDRIKKMDNIRKRIDTLNSNIH